MFYDSVFISDVHLGSREARPEKLTDFLDKNRFKKLYLVGDIIDGWRLKNNYYWTQEHSNVIRKILSAAKGGTEIIYIPGNHDDFLKEWINLYWVEFGNIKIINEATYTSKDGRNFLVIHGDRFDAVMLNHRLKILSMISTSLYTLIVEINKILIKIRRKFNLPYWSLSRYIKEKVKDKVKTITKFEETVMGFCKKYGYDGVICGHIHIAEIKEVDEMLYMNTGDWIDLFTAIVEKDGKFDLIKCGTNVN